MRACMTAFAGWRCPPPQPGACLADLDGSGAVGMTDHLILLSHWD